ncbi:MAG: hypothetical protein ACTSWC_02370 [Promethearchaeota archaeon]
MLFAIYNLIEYLTEFPKLIEISLFWILGIKIYHADKSKLNITYTISFFVWTLYTLADLIMWITAANDETWFFIDNIIRDIQVVAAVVFAFLIFFSTQIVVKGYQGLNWKQIYIVGSIFLAIAISIALIDKLVIKDPEGNLLDPSKWNSEPLVIVSANISLVTMILMAFPLILYIHSIWMLVRLISHKVDDKNLRKRMFNLIIGISLIPIGIVYFAIVLAIPGIYNAFMVIIGRIFWILAPIFIWKSQKK